jgi:hypothetical protein
MTCRLRIVAAFFAFALAATACFAQSAKPASIVLPKKLVTGQAASLAVLDAGGGLVPGARVEIEGGGSLTTDASGRATFTAPGLAANTRSAILVFILSGTAVKETATVLPAMPAPAAPVVQDSPPITSLSDRFSVTGAGFRGEVDGTGVLLGGKPAIVLAASPVEIVVLAPPLAAPGPTEMSIQVGEQKTAAIPITLASLEISADKSTLAPKEQGVVRVRVIGTEQTMEVELRNATPQVVRLGEEDVLRLRTRGGKDNSGEATLAGVREGEFRLSARLLPLPSGAPNVEAARQKLAAARRAAQGAWAARLDVILERMEKHPEQALQIRDELEKLLASEPPGDLARLIEESWRILIRN